MASTVLRWADRRTEPWANGAGVTHPLAQGVGDSWRVSIAEIPANAQFSRLPDIHRQFICLGPVRIRLYVDERPRDVPVGDITMFSGGSHVRCEIDRPSLALNVMSRIGTPAPSVQLLDLRTGVSEGLP
jgi:environmental stress-induced protein Ves